MSTDKLSHPFSFRLPPSGQRFAFYAKAIDTSFILHMGDVPVKIDPLRTNEVKFNGRVVGYIKGTSEEGNKLMANIVMFDPEIIKEIERTKTPQSFSIKVND